MRDSPAVRGVGLPSRGLFSRRKSARRSNATGDEEECCGRTEVATLSFLTRSCNDVGNPGAVIQLAWRILLQLERSKGESDEQRSRPRRHPQGRLHPYIRRQAPEVGRQRPPFWRMGDLPSEGLAS